MTKQEIITEELHEHNFKAYRVDLGHCSVYLTEEEIKSELEKLKNINDDTPLYLYASIFQTITALEETLKTIALSEL